MITMGLDIGSLFSKAVILKDGEVAASEIRETTGTIAQEIDQLIESVLQQANLRPGDVEVLVSTGAGEDLVKTADFGEDDVACIAMATHHFLPDVNLTIDIGGQSIATILSDGQGEILDFMRNDKCASGSGRFLEMITAALGVPLDQVDQTVEGSGKIVPISSQCGVFAESEVISYVNQGEKVPDIIAGICDAVSKIVVSQTLRFGNYESYTVTGGVARVNTIPRMMGEMLPGKYYPFPLDPQLAAAFGAALIGTME